jgi:16S rRNA (guanine1207-N2)-methyltransferase
MREEVNQVVTAMLLDETRAVPADGGWLVLGGEAALPAGIRRDQHLDHLVWIPTDVREFAVAPADVVVSDDFSGGTGSAAYERAVLPMPPDRDLARRWLVTAREALVPGGLLLLAGANAEGIRPVITDATALFGPPQSEHYRQRHRVARFLAGEKRGDDPAWARWAGIAPGTWQEFDLSLGEDPVTLETMPGVFAGDRLDAGTRLMLEHLHVEAGTRVLDVGCGAGVIGIRASRLGASSIDLVDANLLAVAAARRNLRRLEINGRALASDVYSAVAGERYDLIVSNPPFHHGKRVDLTVADALIAGAPGHLRPQGRLLVVANAFLAYGNQMERVFRRVETVAATRQYHVLTASEPG